MKEEMKKLIESYIEKIRQYNIAYAVRMGLMSPTGVDVEYGRKYAKIISISYNSCSVFAFVNRETGAILKAASWKTPAKWPRGTVYSPNPPVDGLQLYLR